MASDIEENQRSYRTAADATPRALETFLGDLLGIAGRVRCYETTVDNPSQQLKNKLGQARAAKRGLLHLVLKDEPTHRRGTEQLVRGWATNDEWDKAVSAVAVAYRARGGVVIGSLVVLRDEPWLAAIKERLFPMVEVLRAEGGSEEEAVEEGTASRTRTAAAPPELFLEDSEFDSLLALWRRRTNLVFQGPPGVGKTFVARRLVDRMTDGDATRLEWIQFHQSYSYEDFVQGWRPTPGGAFERTDGAFFTFCRRAAADPRPYVFVIDEINRGNLSKIFGDSLMLLEPDKRGIEITLTYQRPAADPGFSIPSNVFLLGMMNTADRSISIVDYALRRRFAFVDLRPRYASERFATYLADAGVPAELIQRIRDRMGNLNRLIREDRRHLGPGFEVGHSFFCTFDGSEDPELWYERVVRYEIAPLLREYWFDADERATQAVDALLE